MFRVHRIVIVALGILALSSAGFAQGWRGQGRVAGKVTDEAGKPLAGVTVKLFLPSVNGGTDTRTSNKGDWAVAGISRGAWQIDFEKKGYETRRINVAVEELTRLPLIEIVMKVAAPDPNTVIAAEMQKAAALIADKKFAEAQAIYADLLSKYPMAYQIELSIARAYHAEGDFDNEIAHLRKFLEQEPDNVEVKLLTGAEMIAKGDPAEGQALLATIDDRKVTEPAVFLNVGINMLNQNRPKEALAFFQRTITRFPEYPDGYYYRGITELQIGTMTMPDDEATGKKLLESGKADLMKFVQMAPDAPEAALARKMLEQLK